MRHSEKNQSGFTLIELMVVVAIIAILSTIGIGGFSNAQRKSRDARRRADVKTIQSYMVSSSDTNGNLDILSAVREAGGRLPEDPARNGRYFVVAPISVDTIDDPEIAIITDNGKGVVYRAVSTNSGFVCARLEIPNSGNATQLGATATLKLAASESLWATAGDNTTLKSISHPPAVPGGATATTPDVGITYENGTFLITPCQGNVDTANCNLFCATF